MGDLTLGGLLLKRKELCAGMQIIRYVLMLDVTILESSHSISLHSRTLHFVDFGGYQHNRKLHNRTVWDHEMVEDASSRFPHILHDRLSCCWSWTWQV